jgi:hypothetical protein
VEVVASQCESSDGGGCESSLRKGLRNNGRDYGCGGGVGVLVANKSQTGAAASGLYSLADEEGGQ